MLRAISPQSRKCASCAAKIPTLPDSGRWGIGTESTKSLTESTGHKQGFACNPGCVRGGEEHGGGGDVLDLSDTAERCLGFDLRAEFAFGKSGGDHALGHNHS